MNQTNIFTIIYALGLIFGAFFLGLWSSDTGPKALLGLGWTAIFLISLFFADRKKD
tara:strand:+ start:184 stop:351 length:168 start_codon:yes stop_codon:yes gene_type:complete